MGDFPREALRERVLRSAQRLVDFLEMDAPDKIVAQEMVLLEERLNLLCSTAMSEARMDRKLSVYKPRAGYCREEDCWEPAGEEGQCADHEEGEALSLGDFLREMAD